MTHGQASIKLYKDCLLLLSRTGANKGTIKPKKQNKTKQKPLINAVSLLIVSTPACGVENNGYNNDDYDVNHNHDCTFDEHFREPL